MHWIGKARSRIATLVTTFGLIGGMSDARASMLITIEAPGVQSTSVSGATTERFNSLSKGLHDSYVSSIGTYTGQFAVVEPNSYGGASGTQYFSVGAQSHSTQATLALNAESTYFGFFWAAGDALNQLDFYRGGNLVSSFRTSDVISFLAKLPNRDDYYGNPNNHQDAGEPFAYLNFYGQDGLKFDRVVFKNDSTGTGFESDNHSISSSLDLKPHGTNIPGVPEPPSYLLGLIAGFGVVVQRWQRS